MIARYFIERPHFAAVIAILTVLCGAVCIRFFPISQYPDITPVQIYVAATYPGADAQVIRESIAAPIEDGVNNIPGILYMSSQSGNDGTYALSVYFELGTDADIAEVQVQNRISLASAELPAAVLQQGVQVTKQSGDMIMIVSLYSPDGSRDELFLSNYAANHLHDELQRVTGVANVQQFGQQDYSMRIWINPIRMAALNVTAGDIANAIEKQNVAAAAGQVGAPPFDAQQTEFQFKLLAEGLLHDVADFERIVVATGEDGSLIRIADVARVELGSATYAGSSQLNGEAAALVAIYQQSDANALDISQTVNATMAEYAKRFPDGVAYTVSYDVAKPVRASINDILITLVFTAILVVAVTYLFLGGWRATLVPAIAIPVSLMGAIALIYAIGFSANMITLFALLLAITLVVDDAIIIVENAERILSEREIDIETATLEAMEQVNRPILSTTFVLAAVFVPVCFFPGLTGIIYYQFAATIIFAFVLSAINALTLGPVLCVMMLKRGVRPNSLIAAVAQGIAWVRSYYLKAVSFMVRSSTATVSVLAVASVLTFYLFTSVPTGLIPQEDNGVLLVSTQLPAGASLQRTSTFLAKLETIAKQSPGVDSVITVSGYSLLKGMSSDVGMAVLTLLPRNERSAPELAWRAIMQNLNVRFAALPEAETYVFPIPSIPGLGSAGGVSAELLDLDQGDAAQLQSVMSGFIASLNAAPEFASASGNFSGKTPQYELLIDRDRAQTLGIEIADVFTALQANLSSYYVNNFFREERIYWVIMSADAPFRQTIADIDKIYVKGSAGQAIPLSSFVNAEPVLAPNMLPRFNLFSAASISAQVAEGVSTGQGIKAMQALARDQLPDGYQLVFSGSSQQEVQAGGLVIWIMISAALLAYLVLVVLYESWILPLSVMASTVFALLGALIPIALIPGLSNNIFAQIGMVLLIGLAAKKAIMVVEFANQRRIRGAGISEAALTAATIRFRPVTMTGMCFIIGVLPLIFTTDVGSAARQSIGYPVLVGMLIDSTLGLVMIPALYALCERLRGSDEVTAPATN